MTSIAVNSTKLSLEPSNQIENASTASQEDQKVIQYMSNANVTLTTTPPLLRRVASIKEPCRFCKFDHQTKIIVRSGILDIPTYIWEIGNLFSIKALFEAYQLTSKEAAFIYKGMVMDVNHTLATYKVGHGSVIHLVKNPKIEAEKHSYMTKQTISFRAVNIKDIPNFQFIFLAGVTQVQELYHFIEEKYGYAGWDVDIIFNGNVLFDDTRTLSSYGIDGTSELVIKQIDKWSFLETFKIPIKTVNFQCSFDILTWAGDSIDEFYKYFSSKTNLSEDELVLLLNGMPLENDKTMLMEYGINPLNPKHPLTVVKKPKSKKS